MYSLFGFLDMADDYEDRLIENTKAEDATGLCYTVDTCRVTDSEQAYETGVEHPSFNEGQWVIVEMYDTESQARAGHARWVEAMKMPPKELLDVSSAEICRLYDDIKQDPSWRAKGKEAQDDA